MVNRVVPREELHAAARELVASITRMHGHGHALGEGGWPVLLGLEGMKAEIAGKPQPAEALAPATV